jgi:hypothetical protein
MIQSTNTLKAAVAQAIKNKKALLEAARKIAEEAEKAAKTPPPPTEQES